MDREEAAQRLGIPTGLPVLLVFGGSQSVRRLDEAMAAAVGDLVERLRGRAHHRPRLVRPGRRAA